MFKENDIVRFKKGTRCTGKELGGTITKVLSIDGDIIVTNEVKAIKTECINLTERMIKILKEKCDWLGFDTVSACLSAFYNTPISNLDFTQLSMKEVGILFTVWNYARK